MARTLDIIIVNWNAGTQLRDCLAAIGRAEQISALVIRTIVVDNASSDDSLDQIATVESSRLHLEVLKNDSNVGFAKACNQGARTSTADYILVLNPDTQIAPDALDVCVSFMEDERNSSIGILGIQLVDAAGTVRPTCARFPTPGRFISKMFGLDKALPRLFPPHFITEWDHADSRFVDQVMGAFFFIRRAVFESLDGFDERFFLYFEEVDLSLRALMKGWHTYYLASAQCYHRGGGLTDQVKATRLFYSLRSRILYGFKHFGRLQGGLLLASSLIIEPFARLAQAAFRRSLDDAVETIEAYGRLLTSLHRTLLAANLKSKP